MILLARLGFWQLNRLEQRRARNAELMQQLEAPPLELDGRPLAVDPVELRDRPAQASGRFDYSRQLILTQQSWQGAPGAHLITPLIIDGSSRAVLVDRGWIPASEVMGGDLHSFEETGEQSVAGHIQLSQTLSGGRQTVTSGIQDEWYRVDIEAIQSQMPYELLPVYLVQSPKGPVQELPYRADPDVDLSEGPHLGYAIQWFIFALLLGAGYARFVGIRSGR